MQEIKKQLHSVRAFVFDVDGVFTDSTVMLHPGGNFIRMMNIKDGFAVHHAVRMGYHVAIITGGRSAMVRRRFAYLGVKDIYMKSASKKVDLERFCTKRKLAREHILYMGDDLPDYEVMKLVGFPCCPSDAAEEIKQISCYISDRKGGEGCVRDAIEQVMRVQGKWMNDWTFTW
ncbi:MAG: HAD hydrolase family protein [Bacteroidales bacterium]|nr:HAD hydrolase family protein [Bacteroidales bacterium]